MELDPETGVTQDDDPSDATAEQIETADEATQAFRAEDGSR